MNHTSLASVFSTRAIILFGFAIGLLGLIFSATPMGRSFEQRHGLDLLFTARGPVPAPHGAFVLAFDSPDVARETLAEVVDALVALDVSVIAINIFLESSRDPRTDEKLADSIERSDRVILFLDIADKGPPVVREPLNLFSSRAEALGSLELPHTPYRVDYFWPFHPVSSDSDADANNTTYFRGAASGQSESPSIPVAALHLNTRRRLGMAGWTPFPLEGKASPDGVHEVDQFLAASRQLRAATSMDEAARIIPHTQSIDLDDEARSLVDKLIRTYAWPTIRFINYYGPAESVPRVDYRDLLNAYRDNDLGRLDALADTAAFVGYAPPHNPRGGYQTVYLEENGDDLSGTEIAATAYLNLVHDQSIVRPVPLLRTAIILAVGFVLGAGTLLLRPALSVALSLLLAAVIFVSFAIAFFASGLWLPLYIPLAIQTPSAFVLGMIAQYLQARNRRNLYLESLERYVPAGAVRQLEAAGTVFSSAEMVYGACLFVDMVGYTNLSEKHADAARLAEFKKFVDTYYALLTPIIRESGGERLGMAGDEVLGVWTSPVEDSDVGLRACTAALRMLEAIDDYNRNHAQLPILTRFGLDAGWIEQGNFGAGADYSFNVIGDAVNTAKRIEGLNKTLGTRILVSAQAASRIDTLTFRFVGSFLLKGKSHPIEVMELVGRTDFLSDSTVENCRLFEQALRDIHRGDIQQAFTLLDSIRREDSGDGPTNYYLSLIEGGDHNRVIRSDGVVVLND